MSRPEMKRHIIYLLILGLMYLLFTSSLVAAEEVASGEQPQNEEVELASSEKMLQGKIDRVGESELVIDDSLYTFSSGSGLRAGSFSEGQTVSGELDKNGRIMSLQIVRRAAKKAGTAWQETSGDGDIGPSNTGQTLHLEDGVWKN